MAYHHAKATWALTKANFKSILRSPSAVIFTIVFPIIFILAFQLMSGGKIVVDVGVLPETNMKNELVRALQENPIFKVEVLSSAAIETRLQKGSLDATLSIKENATGIPKYDVHIQHSVSGRDKVQILHSYLLEVMEKSYSNPNIHIEEHQIKAAIHRPIDFILPGQLGFSLLSTGIFGTAFVFFSLRQTLVTKRLFATPIRRSSVIIGETLARIGFSLLGVLLLIVIGYYVFHFTLVHGIFTVLSMMCVCSFALVVFMGVGFVISGIAKSESTIPPLSNMITMPQFILSGVIFPIEIFPKWLQPICNVLPLTHLNNALRKIAFDGAGLIGVWHEMLYLGVWGVVVYAVAIKVFKWE